MQSLAPISRKGDGLSGFDVGSYFIQCKCRYKA